VLALAGVGLTILTGDGLWDGIGTMCIGALLVVIAIVLAAETKSLLVGEGASGADREAIEQALAGEPLVERIIHMKTLHIGPDELLVAAKIAVAHDGGAADIAKAIDSAEARIRTAVPIARIIYLEPDLDREAPGPPAPDAS
jgi:divalent metal cation (Fe/Co/Zn/Cd) transporter